MQVKDVMETDVKTIASSSTVQQAAAAMAANGTGYLMVVRDGAQLAGIITEADIVSRVVSKALDVKTTKVDQVMTKAVVMIDPDRDLTEAMEIMEEKNIKKLPVLKSNQLIGILTVSNLCAAQPKLAERVGKLLAIPGQKKIIAG